MSICNYISVSSWILNYVPLFCVTIPPNAGSIPMELGNLSKLEILDLGGNRLSGEVLLSVPRVAEASGPWLTYKGVLFWLMLFKGLFSHRLA